MMAGAADAEAAEEAQGSTTSQAERLPETGAGEPGAADAPSAEALITPKTSLDPDPSIQKADSYRISTEAPDPEARRERAPLFQPGSSGLNEIDLEFKLESGTASTTATPENSSPDEWMKEGKWTGGRFQAPCRGLGSRDQLPAI